MKRTTLCLCIVGIIIVVIGSIFLYKHLQKNNIPEEFGTIETYFCPEQQCETALVKKIEASKETIHCAFYDVDESIINALQKAHEEGKEVALIMDKDNKETFTDASWIHFDERNALMHNKFCIFDGKEIMTGSMNPTENDISKNANNLIFISSQTLAKNYEEEFQSLEQGDFGEDDAVRWPKFLFNNFTLENYFCPEDHCEEHILATLQEANESILFMQFSFTSDAIGSLLLEKSDKISVTGIFERTQISQYSQHELLQSFSCLFQGGKLHHKVFIIDNETVITGSMNPSNNGDKNNDENILIIHNKEIAALFVEEFEKRKKECI